LAIISYINKLKQFNRNDIKRGQISPRMEEKKKKKFSAFNKSDITLTQGKIWKRNQYFEENKVILQGKEK